VNLILASTMEHVLILYMTIIVHVNTVTLDVIVRMVRIYTQISSTQFRFLYVCVIQNKTNTT